MLALHLPDCPANTAVEKAFKADTWKEARLSKIDMKIQANA